MKMVSAMIMAKMFWLETSKNVKTKNARQMPDNRPLAPSAIFPAFTKAVIMKAQAMASTASLANGPGNHAKASNCRAPGVITTHSREKIETNASLPEAVMLLTKSSHIPTMAMRPQSTRDCGDTRGLTKPWLSSLEGRNW